MDRGGTIHQPVFLIINFYFYIPLGFGILEVSQIGILFDLLHAFDVNFFLGFFILFLSK